MRLIPAPIQRLLRASLLVPLLCCLSAAGTENILYSFRTFAHGQGPGGGLISDSAGNLYGVTFYGGAYGFGTVFMLSPRLGGGWTESLLYSFKGTNAGSTDGWYPSGALVFDSVGNLYGATQWGGIKGRGTIFQLTPSSTGLWTEQIIWSFQQNSPHDGFNPQGSLLFDSRGNLYGSTRFGGGFTQQSCSFDGGCGMVFRLTPHQNRPWSESVLYVFQGNADGAYPNEGLTFDQQGNLYGTNQGLSNSHGLVFKLAPSTSGSWIESSVYSFTGGADGAYPGGGVIFDQAGNLYGTTTGGGTSTACFNRPCGTVFKLAPQAGGTWSESVLHSFDLLDGESPAGSLAFDSAGNLYGATVSGGNASLGVAFQLVPSAGGGWSENVLWNFTGGTDGDNPNYGVAVGPNGQVWGPTGSPFGAGNGTIVQLKQDAGGHWNESTIAKFSDTDGALPLANLIADQEGNLYGTTSRGGLHTFGSVFELIRTNNGQWREYDLFDFPDGTVAGPNSYSNPSPLIFDSAGNLYVATTYGGTNNHGAVYQLFHAFDHAWVTTKIFTFSGTASGTNPVGNLVFDKAGNLYGTTSRGGSGTACRQGCGTVFELSPRTLQDWAETVLYNFQGGSDGAIPQAGLIFDQVGNLYGTTASGGAVASICFGGCGTVYELLPASTGGWNEQVLHRFTYDHQDGASPLAGLILDESGNLYGTTAFGGKHDDVCGYGGCGTVFKVARSSGGLWTESSLHLFDGSEGKFPLAGLVLDSAGNLYGTTEEGGPGGNVFELSPNPDGSWAETVLYNFSTPTSVGDGYFPEASLILDQAGNLYGTTAGGGAANNGTVFEIVK